MNWYNVGTIVNTHGVMGEVRVISHTDFPEERFVDGKVLHLFMPKSKQSIPLTIKSHRPHKNFMLLTFENHPYLQDVEKYRKGILKISEEELQPLPEGQYYFHEILGCTVELLSGEVVGEITDILQTGANDVWEVKRKNKKPAYIPYIPDVVKEVLIEKKLIRIDPLEGLLE